MSELIQRLGNNAAVPPVSSFQAMAAGQRGFNPGRVGYGNDNQEVKYDRHGRPIAVVGADGRSQPLPLGELNPVYAAGRFGSKIAQYLATRLFNSAASPSQKASQVTVQLRPLLRQSQSAEFHLLGDPLPQTYPNTTVVDSDVAQLTALMDNERTRFSQVNQTLQDPQIGLPAEIKKLEAFEIGLGGNKTQIHQNIDTAMGLIKTAMDTNAAGITQAVDTHVGGIYNSTSDRAKAEEGSGYFEVGADFYDNLVNWLSNTLMPSIQTAQNAIKAKIGTDKETFKSEVDSRALVLKSEVDSVFALLSQTVQARKSDLQTLNKNIGAQISNGAQAAGDNVDAMQAFVGGIKQKIDGVIVERDTAQADLESCQELLGICDTGNLTAALVTCEGDLDTKTSELATCEIDKTEFEGDLTIKTNEVAIAKQGVLELLQSALNVIEAQQSGLNNSIQGIIDQVNTTSYNITASEFHDIRTNFNALRDDIREITDQNRLLSNIQGHIEMLGSKTEARIALAAQWEVFKAEIQNVTITPQNWQAYDKLVFSTLTLYESEAAKPQAVRNPLEVTEQAVEDLSHDWKGILIIAGIGLSLLSAVGYFVIYRCCVRGTKKAARKTAGFVADRYPYTRLGKRWVAYKTPGPAQESSSPLPLQVQDEKLQIHLSESQRNLRTLFQHKLEELDYYYNIMHTMNISELKAELEENGDSEQKKAETTRNEARVAIDILKKQLEFQDDLKLEGLNVYITVFNVRRGQFFKLFKRIAGVGVGQIEFKVDTDASFPELRRVKETDAHASQLVQVESHEPPPSVSMQLEVDAVLSRVAEAESAQKQDSASFEEVFVAEDYAKLLEGEWELTENPLYKDNSSPAQAASELPSLGVEAQNLQVVTALLSKLQNGERVASALDAALS